MYDTILVAVDGSDHARRAADHAGALAAAFDATVQILAVVDVDAAAGPFDAGGVGGEFVDELRASGEATATSIAETLAATVTVDTAVAEGDPEKTILERADAIDADLLALGTHGRTGLQRFVVGSVAEQVIRGASVPVLTARATEAERATAYDDVLVPTDGSAPAAAAVDHAIAVAAAVDATVHAVSVVDLGDVAAAGEYTVPTDLIESLEDRGETAVADVAERADAAGLESVTAVRAGDPGGELLEYVEEAGVDLVAMGTAGRSGLDRFLLGSTTERLVRHAPVPVLSVNAGE